MSVRRFHDTDISPAVREAAARWFGLRERGLTPAQEAELAAWQAADERHAAALAELDLTWGVLDGAGHLRPATCEPDADLLAPPRRARRFALPVGLAAAAALVIAFVTLRQPTAAPFVETATTEVGGFRQMELPDGSTLRLNTATAVEVNYSATERRVNLVRGEAHFTVAKNAQRPFVVRAGRVDVRAVGTAFNVRRDTAAVEILVTEGKVRIDDAAKGESLLVPRAGATPTLAAEPPLLVAGERALIPATAAPEAAAPVAATAVPQPQIQRTLAWHARRLEFASTPLADVVAEFNRYNRHQLVIADAQLATLRFGGTFRPDAYDALVRLLETNFDVAAERQEHQTILRSAAK